VIRALLLITLGLSLVFIPDKTHKMLFNAMGLFWLTSGLALVRQEARPRGSKLLLVLAILGVLAGVLVVTRDLSRMWLAEVWVKGVLGAIILLTGVLHVTSYLRSSGEISRGMRLVEQLLGVAEIVLGVLLLTEPTGREQIVYDVATAWALLGGGLVLYTTVRQGLRRRRQVQPEPAQAQPESIGSQPEEDGATRVGC
jgi:uncharacterized membrane protein HdeD (DUF308 family)